MDGYDAIRALTALVETCREGNFYEDYDASCSLIGEADRALAFLTPLALGAAFEPNETRYLLRYLDQQRERWVDTMGDRAAHNDIVRRDYALRQIEALDSMCHKINGPAQGYTVDDSPETVASNEADFGMSKPEVLG